MKADNQRMFNNGKTFKRDRESVTTELLGAYFNKSTWAGIVTRRIHNVTDTIPHFYMKKYLIGHTWARRVELN